MATKLKTLSELTQAPMTGKDVQGLEALLKINRRGGGSLKRTFKEDYQHIRNVIESLNDYAETLEDQKKLLENVYRAHKKYGVHDKQVVTQMNIQYMAINKTLAEQLEQQEKLRQAELDRQRGVQQTARAYNLGYKTVEQAINKVVKQSNDLFKISHDLQLQGNMTWRDYSKLYNESFNAIRDMNKELGQSVFNTRQLFEAQQKLVPQGWKGIDTKQLSDLSQAVVQINAVLGTFPQELSTAFQMSQRQFEAQTNEFVYAIGNRLNAFSNSFGVTVGALTGAVTQMMAANSFLMRNNMQAQILANESLMQAVALSSAVGIETSNFMVGLAKTTQFGTASQMSDLYQTGAMLQGFSVADFQSRMQGGDYMGATQDLIQSIQGTLGGMDAGYLRNEYMQKIASGFGLSQDDILQIMSNDFDLSEKALEIQEKLVDVDMSMEKELKDLKVGLLDRLDNWWDSTQVSQGFGKLMQDLGMTNVNKQLTAILFAIMGQDLQRSIFKKLTGTPMPNIGGVGAKAVQQGMQQMGPQVASQGMFGLTGGVKTMPQGMMGKVGMGLGGAALMGASSHYGSQWQQSNSQAAQIGGGLVNVLGQAGGGAMMGSMFGPIGTAVGGTIGAIKGISDTINAAEQRKSALADIEGQRRQQNRGTQQSMSQDPVLNELVKLNNNVRNVIQTVDGNLTANREISIIQEMTGKAKTSGV